MYFEDVFKGNLFDLMGIDCQKSSARTSCFEELSYFSHTFIIQVEDKDPAFPVG